MIGLKQGNDTAAGSIPAKAGPLGGSGCESLLSSVSFAASSFLQAESWRDRIDEVLAHFGESLNISRIYIFQNFADDAGRLYMSQQYEWVKNGITPQIDNPELKKLYYHEAGLERLVEVMSAGGVIKGLVKDFPESERKVLEAQDILTVFITPVFVKDHWWGFIGFDECEGAREWTSLETHVLKTVAGIFTAALENEANAENLKTISRSFTTLFNSSPDAIFVYDMNGNVLDVNQAGCDLNGYDKKTLTGMHFTKLIPASLRRNSMSIFENWKKGQPAFIVSQSLHASGKEIPVEIRGTRTRYFNTDALLLLVRNISDRVQNEALLQQKLEFIQFISQISSNFIKLDIAHVDEAITHALEYVCNFTGNERAFVFRADHEKKVMELSHLYHRPKTAKNHTLPERFSMSEYPDYMELLGSGRYTIRHHDELGDNREDRQLKMTLEQHGIKSIINIPLIVGKHFLGLMGFVAYSEKKNWDEDTLNAFMLTAQIIANATIRKRSEKELLQAKEKAEESDRLKTMFLGQMSHELRTPLNSILGFAEIIERETAAPEVGEMASYIIKAGSRLLNTLNLLIDLSQIESNLMETRLEKVNLNDLIHELSLLFAHEAARKNIDLSVSEQSAEIMVTGDLNQIEKILYNLLDNAIKYTHRGFIKISLTITTESGKAMALVEVQDSGIGISAERRPFVFERFRQASEGYNREYEGAGIGLAVSRKMVEMMNGKISFESTPGKGSSFRVMFPLHPDPHDSSAHASKKISATPRKKKILVVEDEFTHRKYLSYILAHDYNLVFANDGDSGLKALHEAHPDAVIIDINLGKDMNGMQLMKAIRQTAHGKKLPIAAVTANVMKGQKEELLGEGFDFYLSKPFKIEEMKKLVARMFG